MGCDWPAFTTMLPDVTPEKIAFVKFIPVTFDSSKFVPVASTPLRSTFGPVINAGLVDVPDLGFAIRYPLGNTVVLEYLKFPVRNDIPASDTDDKFAPEISVFERLTPLKLAFPSVRLFKLIPGPAMNRPIKLSVNILYEYVMSLIGCDVIRTGPPPVLLRKYVFISLTCEPLKSRPLTSI
jgi:hypothetical protein